jgi:hypothetical protein
MSKVDRQLSRPFARLSGACLALGLAALFLTLPAVAAPADRPPVAVRSADLGYAFELPAGTSVDLQRYPHASPGQTREIAMILAGGAEIARLDVFLDPPGKDLAQWVNREFAFQVKHGKLRSARAGVAQVAALELALPGGQVEPQTLLFWRQGRLGLRLTLVASAQALARKAFSQAAASFSAGTP